MGPAALLGGLAHLPPADGDALGVQVLVHPVPVRKGGKDRGHPPDQFRRQNLRRALSQQLRPLPAHPVTFGPADVRVRQVKPGRQLLLPHKGGTAIPRSPAAALRPRHVRQAQEQHQHPRPERVIASDLHREVAAQLRLVAAVVLAGHADPGLLPPAVQTAQPKQRETGRLLEQRKPTALLDHRPPLPQPQAQVEHQEQLLPLPEQPPAGTPFRPAAQLRPARRHGLPQPQQPGAAAKPTRSAVPAAEPEQEQERTAEQRGPPGVRQVQPTTPQTVVECWPQQPPGSPPSPDRADDHSRRTSHPTSLAVWHLTRQGKDQETEND